METSLAMMPASPDKPTPPAACKSAPGVLDQNGGE
jgi:hypothetical protein